MSVEQGNILEIKQPTTQQSTDSIIILNDASLVSIQDSSSASLKKDSDASTNSEVAIPTVEATSPKIQNKPSKIFENFSLEDLCNPNKFTLNLNDDGSKRKQKITKNDFLKVSNLSPSINDGENGQEKSSDPFFSLDPLRKL